MARSGKIGIDYWSHDSDMSSDKKIRIIMAKHGIAGYGFFNLLLDRIFGDKGYYLQIDDDFNILFSNDCNIDLNAYILMLNDCIEKELFDKDLYDKYNILTSRRIQKNYCDACQRRKEMFFIKDYMLLEPEKEFGPKVNVYISSLNADIKGQNADISKQIEREKESKEKKKVIYPDKDFISFWNLYEIKTGKKAAYNWWKKTDKPPIGELLKSLQAQIEHKKSCDRIGKFCPRFPDPERWIKNRRWEDEIDEIKQTSIVTRDKSGMTLEDHGREWLSLAEDYEGD